MAIDPWTWVAEWGTCHVVVLTLRFAKNMLADLEDIMAGKSFKTDDIEHEIKKVIAGLEDLASS